MIRKNCSTQTFGYIFQKAQSDNHWE